MILKETDPKPLSNKFEKFGHEAEKQMAFYLKRAFQDNTKIFVTNDLRIQMGDDVAQIDHLVLHEFGFVIIESKSVTAEIVVNEQEEWMRRYGNSCKGMPSPVNQAQRQIDLLKRFLVSNCDGFLRKFPLVKSTMSNFQFDSLVAISDSGIIEREKGALVEQVCKADQIPDRIEGIIKGYTKTNNPFRLTLKVLPSLRVSTMGKISTFLLKSHTPVHKPREEKFLINPHTEKLRKQTLHPKNDKKDIEPPKGNHEKLCPKCGSIDIQIRYGKYGYYFYCNECEGNTAIRLKCEECNGKAKVRKSKLQYFKECPVCKTSELYFENRE